MDYRKYFVAWLVLISGLFGACSGNSGVGGPTQRDGGTEDSREEDRTDAGPSATGGSFADTGTTSSGGAGTGGAGATKDASVHPPDTGTTDAALRSPDAGNDDVSLPPPDASVEDGALGSPDASDGAGPVPVADGAPDGADSASEEAGSCVQGSICNAGGGCNGGGACQDFHCLECRPVANAPRHDFYGVPCENGMRPQYEECSDSQDCSAGRVCNFGGACVECNGDAHCPEGSLCRSHTCKPACDTDQECGSLGLLCYEGRCSECRVDADCPENTRCVAGECVLERCDPSRPPICHVSGTGIGVFKCRSDGRALEQVENCARDETCVIGNEGGECVPRLCESGSSHRCLAGTPGPTWQACSEDGTQVVATEDCGSDEYCTAEGCRACADTTLFCSLDDAAVLACSDTGEPVVVEHCPQGSHCSPIFPECTQSCFIPGPICVGQTAYDCAEHDGMYSLELIEVCTEQCVDGTCASSSAK